MKKILLSIFWIFFWLSAFCSADQSIILNAWDHWCIWWIDLPYEVYSFSSNVSWIFYYSCMMWSWSDINSCWYMISNYTPNDDPIWMVISDQYWWCYSFIPYTVWQYSSNISLDLWDYWCIVDNLWVPSFSFSSDWLFWYSCFYWWSSFSSECWWDLVLVSSDTVIDSIWVDSQYNLCFSYFPNSPAPSDIFIVNYWSTSKEYTLTEDIDIFINSPVVKNWNIFTFDWSTWINLVYNWSYNWYTKNKLYLWWQFWYRQGVFTPICF